MVGVYLDIGGAGEAVHGERHVFVGGLPVGFVTRTGHLPWAERWGIVHHDAPAINTESDDQSVPPIATPQPVMKSDPVGIVRSTLSKELIGLG